MSGITIAVAIEVLGANLPTQRQRSRLMHCHDACGVSLVVPFQEHINHHEPSKEPGTMNEHKRILVIAQPELGRRLEQYLRAAGWSVYRSPDTSLIAETVRSVKPRILIVGLDAPWFDQETLAKLLAATACETPVLALTDTSSGHEAELATFLPASIEPQSLLAEMTKAIEGDERCRRELDSATNTHAAWGEQSGAN